MMANNITASNYCMAGDVRPNNRTTAYARYSDLLIVYHQKHDFQDVIDKHSQSLHQIQLCKMDRLKHPPQERRRDGSLRWGEQMQPRRSHRAWSG